MVFESIPNFDQYVFVAVGLFIVGLLSVMVYERSNSSSSDKQEKQSSSKPRSSSTQTR
ncbi:MAG: hypothetical protein MUO21_07040 [Nitrososphaeraceae archaeon]|nr:hypothetical protein [Nitrososphaeraceae archaeon]